MEKYYLKINGQSVFIATFITDNPNTIVHNKPLKKGHGRFLLNTIFARRVLNWDSYDAGIHCPGSYFSWNMKDARKFKTKPRKEIITATVAKDFNGAQEVKRGRKRNCDPSNPKAAIRKQRRNRGQSYSPCLKKGQDKKKQIKKKEIDQPCPESCKRKCLELISPEDHEAIFSKYWDIGDVGKQWKFIAYNVQVKPNN